MPAGEMNAQDPSTRVTRSLRIRLKATDMDLATTTPKKTPSKAVKDAKPLTNSPAIRTRRNSTTNILNQTPAQSSPARRVTRRISLAEAAAEPATLSSPIRKSIRLSANSEDLSSTPSKNNVRLNSGNLPIIEQSVPEEEEMPITPNKISSLTSSPLKQLNKTNENSSESNRKLSSSPITLTKEVVKTMVTRSSSKSPLNGNTSRNLSSDKLNTSTDEKKFTLSSGSLEIVVPTSKTSKENINNSPIQSPRNGKELKVDSDMHKHDNVDEEKSEDATSTENLSSTDPIAAKIHNLDENTADTAKGHTIVEDITIEKNIKVVVQSPESPPGSEILKNSTKLQSPTIDEMCEVSSTKKHGNQERDRDEDVENNIVEQNNEDVTKTASVSDIDIIADTSDIIKDQTIDEETIKDKNIEIENQNTESHAIPLKTNAGNVEEFPKSWSQPVKGNIADSNKVAFIDGFIAKQTQENKEISEEKTNVSVMKNKPKRVIERDDENENNEAESTRTQFIEFEAMEASDDDSMNSSERAYILENEIPVAGESIGSKDTDEELSDEEDNEEIDSFIASEDDEEKLSGTDSLYGNEIESKVSKNRESKYRKIKTLIIESSSDEEPLGKICIDDNCKDESAHVGDTKLIFSESKEISEDNSISIEYISSDKEDEIMKQDNRNGSAEICGSISYEVPNERSLKNEENQSDTNDIELIQQKSLNTSTPTNENCTKKAISGGLRPSIKATNLKMLTQEIPNVGNIYGSDPDTDIEVTRNVLTLDSTPWKYHQSLRQIGNVTENESFNETLSSRDDQNAKETKYDNRDESKKNSPMKARKSPMLQQQSQGSKKNADETYDYDNESNTSDDDIENENVNSKNKDSMQNRSLKIQRCEENQKLAEENLDSSSCSDRTDSDDAEKQIENKFRKKIYVKEDCLNTSKKASSLKTEKNESARLSSSTKDQKQRLSFNADTQNTGNILEAIASPASKLNKSLKESVHNSLHFSQLLNEEASSENKSDENEAIEHATSNSISDSHNISADSDKNATFSKSGSENEEDDTLHFSMLHGNCLNRSKRLLPQVDLELSSSSEQEEIPNKQLNTSFLKNSPSNKETISTLSKNLIDQRTSTTVVKKEKQKSIETKKQSIDNILERLDSYLSVANEAKRQVKLRYKVKHSKTSKKKNITSENVDVPAENNPIIRKKKFKEIKKSIPKVTKLMEKELKAVQKAIVKQQQHQTELVNDKIPENKISKKSGKRIKSKSKAPNENPQPIKFFNENITAYEANLKNIHNKSKKIKSMPHEVPTNPKKNLKADQMFNVEVQPQKSTAKNGKKLIVTTGGAFEVSDLSNQANDESIQQPMLKSSKRQLPEKDNFVQRSKKKKLNILNDIPFGPFREEPVTPESKKIINGFKESNLTPKPIGFKVRSILSAGQKEIPQVEKMTKQKNKRKLKIVDQPRHKSVWTSVGFFEVADAENIVPKKQYLPNTHGLATDFLVKPLGNSTGHKNKRYDDVSASALDFKKKSLFNDKVKRQTSNELLQREAKKLASKKY